MTEYHVNACMHGKIKHAQRIEVSSISFKRKMPHQDNGVRVQLQFKKRLVAERERSALFLHTPHFSTNVKSHI